MSTASSETLRKATEQVQTAVHDMRAAQAGLGTGRDAIARDSLRRARLAVQKAHASAAPLLSSPDPETAAAAKQYSRAKSDFDSLNTATVRREKDVFRKNVDDGPSQLRPSAPGSSTAAPRTTLAQVKAQDIKPVDLSSLYTEEHIQTEKLHNAREVETDMQDLHTTYLEFNSLVNKQQEGLDYVSANVTETNNLIDKGHTQLQSASKKQKCFRKWGCIAGVVVILILIGVIIAVIVVTQ